MRQRLRSVVAGILGVAVAWSVLPAEAGWLKAMFKSVHTDYRRNLAWPRPFVLEDREAVWAPMTVMVYNGWRQQNTMKSEHFVEGKAELTEAGRNKVHYICTRVPNQFRAIFVAQGIDQETTAERLEAVQNEALKVCADGNAPEVFPTQHEPESWPADEVNGTYLKFFETQPNPRLPELQGSSAGGSSSSAGS